jgi:hypothetical protein
VGKEDCCGFHTAHDWSAPGQQNADFEISVSEAVDRSDINRKVLNSVAALAGSTDLSLRKAAGDATFKFVSDLVDLGILIQYKLSPTTRAADILDCFSIAAGQWFLNAALTDPIIGGDARTIARAAPPLSFARATIITPDARLISPRAPEIWPATPL